MKKVLSLLLVGIMVVSMIPAAFATTNYTNGTDVEYDAANDDTIGDINGDGQPDNTEYYTVTVPALMAPGTSGNVIAQGTWASNRKLTVTAEDDVTLTNSINAADQKVLDVTFPGIELAGSNTAAVSDTKAVSVADIDNALFGTWSGTFYYDVEMVDNVELITFTIDIWEMQAEKGMTWAELAESDDYKWAVFGPYVYIQDGIAMFRDTNMIKDYTIVDDDMAVNADDVIVAGHTYDAVEDYSAEE